MMLVVDEQIFFGDAVAELDDFEVEAIQADALVAILAEDQRLAVLELDDVLAARVFFGDVEPRAVIEDVAVLQNFDVRGALVRGGFFSVSFRCCWKTSTERATNVASAPIASEIGLNGRSAVPKEWISSSCRIRKSANTGPWSGRRCGC